MSKVVKMLKDWDKSTVIPKDVPVKGMTLFKRIMEDPLSFKSRHEYLRAINRFVMHLSPSTLQALDLRYQKMAGMEVDGFQAVLYEEDMKSIDNGQITLSKMP